MPSLRTIFIAAATGLASFAIAAPLNVPTTVGARGVTDGLPLAFLTGSSSGAEAAAGSASGAGGILGVRDATDGLPLAFLTGSASGAEAAAGSASGGVLGVRGAEPDSLPVVLNCLVGKLEALLAKLTGEYGSKSNVEPSLLEPILEELKMILCEALVAVKLLVGLPLDVVLCLAGKILAAIDIAHILCTVLSLVCSILLLVLKVVGTAAPVLAPLLEAIACVVVDLLTVIFGLVSGLLACLVPLLGGIVADLITLKLWAILDCLKIAH